MNEIEYILKEKIKKEKLTIILYHGTNRKFESHDKSKHRTILNDRYQGNWYCYTESLEVAFKYAEAARNQCYNKEVFLKELSNYLEKDEYFGKEVYVLLNELIENDYGAWETIIKNYSEKNNLEENVARLQFFEQLSMFESRNNILIDDFIDMLDEIEGSKFGIGQEEDFINIFDDNIKKISNQSIKFLKEIGFKDSIPEIRVLVSEITATNVLRTNDKEEAKKALEKGYDLVIFNGENTVMNEPEYLVANKEQIKIKKIITKEVKIKYLSDDHSEWTTENKFGVINLEEKNNKKLNKIK